MDLRELQKAYLYNLRQVTEEKLEIGSLIRTIISIDEGLVFKDGKHSIVSEAYCMNQVTFALQNIKIRLWQAVKILKGYWNFITRSPSQVVFR